MLAILRCFKARFNWLTGSIPAHFGQLSNLQILHLQEKKLIGSIPPEVVTMASLVFPHLNHNELSGSTAASSCQRSASLRG